MRQLPPKVLILAVQLLRMVNHARLRATLDFGAKQPVIFVASLTTMDLVNSIASHVQVGSSVNSFDIQRK